MRNSAWSYLPVETPTSDYYGGQRPGNNLFADTLVCVDLKTGSAQVALPAGRIIRIWDYDISSAPMLADHKRERARDQGGRPADANNACCMCSIA